MKLNAVIRVPSKETFSTNGLSLMGRQSANEGFLKAWFRYTDHREYWCMARYKSEAQTFAALGESIYSDESSRPSFRWISQQKIHKVATVGTAYLPGPQVADIAWVRRRNPMVRSNDFSLVGMTHTTCELPIQDSLANMLIAPVYPWDAQICPSISVQTMVKRLLDDESNWLVEHIGATKIPQVQLPVLPLGVDMSRFELTDSERLKRRQFWRDRWQIDANEVCVLFVGRLDLKTKINLFPTFDALQLTSQQLKVKGDQKIVLVLAGWFATEWDEITIRNGALEACPDVRVIYEDARNQEARGGVWFGADIFTSLVDNVQETFGLTPIEAMAAKLPLVVSDFDGYRESVRDEIDGFRIKTWQPFPGYGVDMIDSHADFMISYRDYVNQISAGIGIDIGQASNSFLKLIQDQVLRIKMGENGFKRALAEYDWARLIPRYQKLFEDLGKLRMSSMANNEWNSESKELGRRYPRRSDPFHSFSHYGGILESNQLLCQGPLFGDHHSNIQDKLMKMMSRPIYSSVRSHLNENFCLDILKLIQIKPEGIILKNNNDTFTLGWLIKCGLLRVV